MDQELDKAMDVEQDQAQEQDQAVQDQPGQGEGQETMESMMEQYDISGRLHKGEVRTGTVVEEMENGWLVDVGYKCEGVLPAREWTHRALVEDGEKPKKGDEIEVQVISVRETEEAQLLLSRWRHELDRRWEALEAQLAQGDIMQVRGLRRSKGGLVVECCGLEGFIPNSHLTVKGKNIGSVAHFIGASFDAQLLEHNRRQHRLLFSRQSIAEKELEEQRAKFYEQVHEGDVVEGEVSSITDFGIFVNIGGGMDGLVHTTEIAWKRNVRIRDLYKKGDKVMVKVIGMVRDTDRISLSIKQVEGDPWATVEERVHKGEVRRGTVTNVTEFGAFVELEPGIEGLIHVGDISWARDVNPRSVFRKGQETEAVVLEVDTVKRRISLGYKQLNDPWKDIGDRYSAGMDITVRVVRLADFGAFVEAEPGVEALIHISQLSNRRVEKPGDVLHEGQEVVARILEVNPEQRRMRLSLSAMEAAPQKHEDRPRKQDSDRRAARESALDDGALQYNPFAEAFREQD